MSAMEHHSTAFLSLLRQHALKMSIQGLGLTSMSPYSRANDVDPSGVVADTVIRRNCSTEIIDVNKLAHRFTAVIKYLEVGDTKGRLHSTDERIPTEAWLKAIPFAQDCQSSNVMLTCAGNGVVLKTIKSISAGEQLFLWFNTNIQPMLTVPFLAPFNIQGRQYYICHICNKHFEYPNPLKIHLVLNCEQLHTDYLWIKLAKEFTTSPKTTPSLNLFPQSISKEPSPLDLLHSQRIFPLRPVPIMLTDVSDSGSSSHTNNSPSSSNQASPILFNGPFWDSGIASLEKNSTGSSNQASPILFDGTFRNSGIASLEKNSTGSSNQASPILFDGTFRDSGIASLEKNSQSSSNQASPILFDGPLRDAGIASLEKKSPGSSNEASPILFDGPLRDAGIASLQKNSPSSSDGASPNLFKGPSSDSSGGQPSPNCLAEISTCSPTISASPFRKKSISPAPGSSFKPYKIKPNVVTNHSIQSIVNELMDYDIVRNPDLNDEQRQSRMENVISELGSGRIAGKLKYKCIICEKTYSKKISLKRHVRIHTGFRPLRCDACEKSYVHPHSYEKHMRLHALREWPYRCKLCDNTLSSETKLKRHMKLCHPQISDKSSEDIKLSYI